MIHTFCLLILGFDFGIPCQMFQPKPRSVVDCWRNYNVYAVIFISFCVLLFYYCSINIVWILWCHCVYVTRRHTFTTLAWIHHALSTQVDASSDLFDGRRAIRESDTHYSSLFPPRLTRAWSKPTVERGSSQASPATRRRGAHVVFGRRRIQKKFASVQFSDIVKRRCLFCRMRVWKAQIILIVFYCIEWLLIC
jgi:hypothetical protein